MSERVKRQTVDLSAYPDLVVIYLGIRVNKLRGLRKLLTVGPQIQKSVAEKPEGLLRHEQFFFSFFPLHLGMRQYWRNFAALEAWTRSGFHRGWWKDFLRDSGGTGFWHETYFMRGGMEAIYDDIPMRVGFMQFAPAHEATGSMFAARQRLGLQGAAPAAVVDEKEL
jgi:fumigallin biosynthesis monooxygenase-like protein